MPKSISSPRQGRGSGRRRIKLPLILGRRGSGLWVFAAVIALVMTFVLALASLLGPLGGGLLAVLIAVPHRRRARPRGLVEDMEGGSPDASIA